jgi:hypothetical protein
MITIVTAHKKSKLDPVTTLNVLKHSSGELFVSYAVSDSFRHWPIRPNSVLLEMVESPLVDVVIQVGYTGVKTEVAQRAENLNKNVVYVKEVK